MTKRRATMSPDRLEAVKEYEKTYYRENREKILEQRKAQYWANHDKKRSLRRVVCSTLKKHKEALADDPERLSTDFLLKLILGDDGRGHKPALMEQYAMTDSDELIEEIELPASEIEELDQLAEETRKCGISWEDLKAELDALEAKR